MQTYTRQLIGYGYLIALALAVGVSATPFSVEAGTVLRAGETVAVTAEQAVSGDFYGAGGRVDLSGTVAGDALIAGGQVRHHGTTSADLHIAGGQVSQLGNVGDDLRILGGEVTVDGTIGGDLVVLGGEVSIFSSAEIGGDLLVLGGSVDVRGNIAGNVLGFSESLRINGVVGGTVDVNTGALTLGDRARVSGDVQYQSLRELSRAQNAEVGGTISRTEPPVPSGVDSRYLIIPLLVLLFAALSAFLLLREKLQATVLHVTTYPLRAALLGFAVILLIPIASVILLASVLGSLLGFVLALSYLLLMVGGLIVAGAVLGSFIARLLGFATEPTALTVTLGTILCYALFLVPIVGPLIAMIVLALTIGSMAELLIRAIR